MRKDLILVSVITSSLALMVIPLSQGMMDILLGLNISLAVLLVVVALYLEQPSDFSTFPSVILIGTTFRLALSIGTTRLILSEADAGEIIETFGEFVVQGSVIIGLVIFLIITVVQFLVVTKGAERVAEVSARFALDAMPGKQMSIDAEMRNGSITGEEAAALRRRLDQDSQFFGAMDGAMKFVKGDAIAGLIIITINLLGGVFVGMSVHSLSFSEAISIYSLLTIGDGLVAQVPALLMALCAGIVVTRVSNTETTDLGSDIFKEMASDQRVPIVASVIVFLIGLIPGFPLPIFAGVAAVLFVSSFLMRRKLRAEEEQKAENTEAEKLSASDADADYPVDQRMRLILSTELASQLDITLLRKEMKEYFEFLFAARGVQFPAAAIDVVDASDAQSVVIEFDEVPIFQTSVPLDHICVPDLDVVLGQQNNESALGDAFEQFAWPSVRGIWVPKNKEAQIRAFAAKPCPIEKILAYTTYRFYEQNLGALFSHSIFQELVQAAEDAEPELMKLVTAEMTDPALLKMFRLLIEDGVPMRPMSLLISSLHYAIHTIDGPTSASLAEFLRDAMKRQLCHRIAGTDGVIGVAIVDPLVEAAARKGIVEARRNGLDGFNDGLIFDEDTTESLIAQFSDIWRAQTMGARPVTIVVAADIRQRMRNFLAANDMHFCVLAPNEISNEFMTHPVELIRLKNEKNSGAGASTNTRRRDAQSLERT